MIFNSVTYILFLFVVVTLYWNIPKKFKPILLVFCSCIFYGFWRWEFLFLILFSTLLDYSISIKMSQIGVKDYTRKRLLIFSVMCNLILLGYFKYTYFIVDNINLFSNSSIEIGNIILPFGISFYTFETISYTVDVYRKIIKAERNLIKYALFVTFFPKLVAGPIQRTSEFLYEVSKENSFKFDNIFVGLDRILKGFFLKVVLADNISVLVDDGFLLNPSSLSAVDVTTLGVLFGFQIYFDFAGYSHIAIGSAKLLGFNIPENFNFPYIATSFKDFWKRWHISLSSWIRDYLYLPLSGVKVISTSASGGIGGKILERNKNKALFITWAIMGLWHGASWTFVIWGLIHSTYVFLERKLNKYKLDFRIKWIIVYLLIMISWIPFRAESVEDTIIMFSKFFDFFNFFKLNMRENNYLIAFVLTILFLLNYSYVNLKTNKFIYLIDVLKYTIMILLTYTFFRPIDQFIYFQF